MKIHYAGAPVASILLTTHWHLEGAHATMSWRVMTRLGRSICNNEEFPKAHTCDLSGGICWSATVLNLIISWKFQPASNKYSRVLYVQYCTVLYCTTVGCYSAAMICCVQLLYLDKLTNNTKLHQPSARDTLQKLLTRNNNFLLSSTGHQPHICSWLTCANYGLSSRDPHQPLKPLPISIHSPSSFSTRRGSDGNDDRLSRYIRGNY